MLELDDVSKSYSRHAAPAVNKISLAVEPGEVLGLVGLNGAGKSTTLRLAAGIILPDHGKVKVDGISLASDKAKASRRLGWLPEQPLHDSSVPLKALARYYSSLAGVPDSFLLNRLTEWEVDGQLSKRFRQLSLGFKKRFSIAVASLFDPTYFLLDEPFNGLDPLAMIQIRQWIARLRTSGKAVVLSSHNLHEVQALSDRVLVIDKGRLIGSLDPKAPGRHRVSSLVVTVTPLDSKAVEILERFGEVVSSGSTAVVKGADLEAAELNGALVRAGYAVKELTPGESELEKELLSLVESER